MASAPPQQRAFGSVGVPPGPSEVKAEKEVSIEFLIEMMKEIVRRARETGLQDRRAFSGPEKEYDEAIDKMHARLWDAYKDFANEFPLIFRWMTSRFEYSERAFRGYITKHHRKTWNTRKDMLVAQVEYVVAAHREKNPNCSKSFIAEFRASVCKNIVEEQECFERATAEAKEKSEAKTEERRRLLRESLQEVAAQLAAAL